MLYQRRRVGTDEAIGEAQWSAQRRVARRGRPPAIEEELELEHRATGRAIGGVVCDVGEKREQMEAWASGEVVVMGIGGRGGSDTTTACASE